MTIEVNSPVVFLDRDGTLNVEKGYIRNLEDLVLIEGAAEAVKRLNDEGIATVLVTNQTGAARNFYPLAHIEALHERLRSLLALKGAHLDAVYYCPHHEEGVVPELAKACQCRKPAVGMIEMAYAEHPQLSRENCFMVGDKTADLGLANNWGARCVLVETGYGSELVASKEHLNYAIDFRARSIVEAVDWIIASLNNSAGKAARA